MPRKTDLDRLNVKYNSVIKDVEWSQQDKTTIIKGVSTEENFPAGCTFTWMAYDKYTGIWYELPGSTSEITCNLNNSIDGELHCIITKNNDYVDSVIVDFDYLCIDRIKYIMHGGFSGEAPENTVPAFELAEGAWGCEADTQVTKDGVWIMFHDDKVNNLTDGKGYVRDLTYKEIQKLNITSGANIANYPKLKIPTLEEYLKVVIKGKLIPVIEVKNGHYTDQHYADFMALIREYQCENYAVIISFEEKILKSIRKLSSDIKMQAIVQWVDFASKNRAKSIGNCELDFNVLFFSSWQIISAHDDNLEVNLWTVDNRSKAIRVEQTGADYITSSWKLYNYSKETNRSRDFDIGE